MEAVYDYSLLKLRMKEFRLSQQDLADEIGISRVSLNKKLHNITGFKQNEIKKICAILNIKDKYIRFYFFTNVVKKVE
ncbi:helix-turn-helix domain-containing protein [Ligilactobacillus salivarius]|uniref:HTH cro/C1-type domain-containing protein n=1 Tax=Ligilactobacillus salivarius cp400 TaxID=1273133 RepID=V6DJS9_9LACO|nr:helix-turn-helix transcriptional regulator [Ligilactobacillus salivarius]MBX0283856.1 helix-turn-helix transcriptional regulator [Ligilactobacillus salivarius]TXJ82888.1 helix-turn-helix transcriptional regulator [Ligilactobacillus salivarius]CDK34273.1 hypothetical protein LSCP400_00701 [Ligilactobacillus salivarius cp400]